MYLPLVYTIIVNVMFFIKPLSQKAHEQKLKIFAGSKKFDMVRKYVTKIIANEKVLVLNLHDSERLLCDVNALNRVIYLASVCVCCTMNVNVVR